MKKLTFVLVLFLAVAVAMPAQANFPDVSEDHWAYEAVEELQAAGVIEGYPDGEFKGSQNMTRYEMALMIARMLDDLNMQLENLDGDLSSLSAEVGDMGSGLTADQADDVAAIVEAMLEEQLPEEDDEEGLTAEQSEQVVNLIRALTAEFNTELRMLREDLGAMEAFAEDNEDNRERIADLEDRMSDVETVQFSGSYSVDFEHKQTFDNDGDSMGLADFPSFVDNYYLPEVDDAYLQDYLGEEGVAGVDDPTYPETVRTIWYDYVADQIQTELDALNPANYNNFAAHLEQAVDNYNDDVPSELQIQKSKDRSFALAGWDVPSGFTGFASDSGFTQDLKLQMDVTTDLFEAVIDLDVLGSDDEVALDSAGLEVSNDFVKGVYETSNTIELNKFALNSKDINGVDLEFKEWGFNAFFGETTETDRSGSTTIDEFADGYGDADLATFPPALYDGEEFDIDEWQAYFTQGREYLTQDYYLLGGNTDIDLGDFTIRASAAMQTEQYELTADSNNLVLNLGSDASFADVDFNLDVATSLQPFDSEADAGFAVFGGMNTSVENVADFDLSARYRNGFSHLYGDASIFESWNAGYDRFEDGLGGDVFAFNLEVDQQLVDLFDGYVNVDGYDRDFRIKAGGGIDDFLVEGLSGDASFQTVILEAGEGRDDSNGNERTAMENTFDVSGEFAATENLTLNAGFEYVQNLGNYDAADFTDITVDSLDRTTLDVGADFEDFEVINNLTLDAGASYSMVMGDGFDYTSEDYVDYDWARSESVGSEDLSVNTIEAYVDLEYELGRATFGNDFAFTNKTGEEINDGNLFDNTFSLDYELVEDVDFESSWNERLFRFSEEDDADDNWSTREIKAGVSIDF